MRNIPRVLGILCVGVALVGCEELFPTVPDSDAGSGTASGSTSSSSAATGSYTYSFTCPSGTKANIPIPNRLSSSCRAEWEFYARTYACNDADRFAEAERRKRACP